MILVADVGNSNIVLGIYRGRTLLHHWRISTNKAATVDEYGMTIPPAIRPDAFAEPPKTRLDIPLLVGIMLGLAGTALIVYLAILLFGPK